MLKVVWQSPARPLVTALQQQTLPFFEPPTFLVLFGVLEVTIGVLFLIRGYERAAIGLLMLHLVTTFMPLVLLSSYTWAAPFVPTLEGQYIIKNLALAAVAIGIAANLTPMRKR